MNMKGFLAVLVVSGIVVDDLSSTTSKAIDMIAERAQTVRHISLSPEEIHDRVRVKNSGQIN